MLARINKLVEDVRRNPFTGIGKPERLKYHLPEAWSRRIAVRSGSGQRYLVEHRPLALQRAHHDAHAHDRGHGHASQSLSLRMTRPESR
jgi:Txe/YoeB family toxin of toxin-antitoxin system